MQEPSSLPLGRGVSLQGIYSQTRAWIILACCCPQTTPTQSSHQQGHVRLSEPRAEHRKSRCLHGELCARAWGPQLPTPLPHGKWEEPQRQGPAVSSLPRGLLVWSPPTKQHTDPCPRLPWPPTKPTPEAGNCPSDPSSLSGAARWRQPAGSPAPRVSPSLAFPSWVTLTQRT